MSLRHILNDDPPPIVRAPSVSTPTPPATIQTVNSGPGGALRHQDDMLGDPISRDAGITRQSPRLVSQHHQVRHYHVNINCRR